MPYITHPFYTETYNQCDRQTDRQPDSLVCRESMEVLSQCLRWPTLPSHHLRALTGKLTEEEQEDSIVKVKVKETKKTFENNFFLMPQMETTLISKD